MIIPFQEKGSALLHIVIACVDADACFTVRFRVTALSQPAALVVWYTTKAGFVVAVAGMAMPFQMKGMSAEHFEIDSILAELGLTVRFSVVVLSHPDTEVVLNVSTLFPPEVMVFPFHKKGS